jgi:chromosome transmission fidelity protein 1
LASWRARPARCARLARRSASLARTNHWCSLTQGKSISLICGALSWLAKNTDEYGLPKAPAASSEDKAAANEDTASTKAAEPTWLADFDRKQEDRETQFQQATMQTALAEIDRIRQEPSPTAKKRKIALAYGHHERKRTQRGGAKTVQSGEPSRNSGTADGEEHLVDSYDSDRAGWTGSGSDSEPEVAPSLVPARPSSFGEEDPVRSLPVVKIIYCSRTHSQISQFIREINKTVFGAHIRVVSLGSRKNLCVNQAVTSLRSDLRMTDKCLDMLQGAKGKTAASKKPAKCPFYEKELLHHYKDYALVRFGCCCC